MTNRLDLSRSQILSFRRQVSALDHRLPATAKSLRQAAWAGLQDSMPRAALLSIHARVANATSAICAHRSLVQLWGPRFSVYVVAAKDLPIFSLGRLPENARRRARCLDTAARLHAFLRGRRLSHSDAGHGMRVVPNSLRYAAPTGTLLIRWDGARQPTLWTAPASTIDPREARLELTRRYLHIFGPARPTSFARWAGIAAPEAHRAFTALGNSLTPVRTPIGDAWILTADEPTFRAKPAPAAAARLLPSGDTFYLLWGPDRELLVPDAKRRAALWTTRVWPGALVVNGEIVGTWRRDAHEISIDLWRSLEKREREAVEAEAMSLPLPSAAEPITVRWN